VEEVVEKMEGKWASKRGREWNEKEAKRETEVVLEMRPFA